MQEKESVRTYMYMYTMQVFTTLFHTIHKIPTDKHLYTNSTQVMFKTHARTTPTLADVLSANDNRYPGYLFPWRQYKEESSIYTDISPLFLNKAAPSMKHVTFPFFCELRFLQYEKQSPIQFQNLLGIILEHVHIHIHVHLSSFGVGGTKVSGKSSNVPDH